MVEYSTHNHEIKGLNSALPQQRERERMVKNENNKISSSEVYNSGKTMVEYLKHNHKIKGLNPTLALAEREW